MSFHQLTASIISQLAALLQLKYHAEDPFATIPTTMSIAVSSIMLCYIIQIGLLLFPMSRFAAVAHHFSVWFAYMAVSTLAVALFPHRAPFIYTILGLLSTGTINAKPLNYNARGRYYKVLVHTAGHMLYVFHEKLAIGDEEEDGEASKFEVYKRRVFRFLKNTVVRFSGQQPQPMLPI